MLISVVGLLIAYYPVTLYCPLNLFGDKDVKGNTLKLMSYNVYNWGEGYFNIDETDINDEEKQHVMIDYFKSVDADIVAIQEGQLKGRLDTLKNIYHYTDSLHSVGSTECMVQLLSKYPITRKENFNFDSKGNGGGAFWVNYNGHEIIVIALHLQSTGLSTDEREKFSTMVHGNYMINGSKVMIHGSDSMKSTSKTVFGKLLLASKKRARQADIIAQFIDSHNGTPIIVMGDFNDIPQSYTHARISDQLLDCYKEKGFGPGYSYKHFGMRVRIDNILCSDEFTPLSCKVDKNIDISDHLPIIATVQYK